MARLRQTPTKNQSSSHRATRRPRRAAAQEAIPLDDGTLTTPAAVAMIQALIPLGLRAVEDALQQEVAVLAGARYAHGDGQPDLVRWGKQPGSIYLADQKLPISVPRVRDQAQRREVSLTTYHQLQTLAGAARPRRGPLPPRAGRALLPRV